jgi:hypothetical protein
MSSCNYGRVLRSAPSRYDGRFSPTKSRADHGLRNWSTSWRQHCSLHGRSAPCLQRAGLCRVDIACAIVTPLRCLRKEVARQCVNKLENLRRGRSPQTSAPILGSIAIYRRRDGTLPAKRQFPSVSRLPTCTPAHCANSKCIQALTAYRAGSMLDAGRGGKSRADPQSL